MKQDGLSLVIYAHNNTQDLVPFIREVDSLLSPTALGYEVLIVEDFHSQPDKSLFNEFPVKFFHVKDKKKLSHRLAAILQHTHYGIVATLADTKTYSLSTIMDMAKVIYQGQSDVLIAQTKKSGYFESLFGLIHQGSKINVRSGLKVFKKEVAERLKPEFLSFSFDLEFITYARDAGYKVDVFQVDDYLEHRSHGSLWDIFYSKLKTKFGRRDVIPFHPEQQKQKGMGFHYRGEEFVHHQNSSK